MFSLLKFSYDSLLNHHRMLLNLLTVDGTSHAATPLSKRCVSLTMKTHVCPTVHRRRTVGQESTFGPSLADLAEDSSEEGCLTTRTKVLLTTPTCSFLVIVSDMLSFMLNMIVLLD